MSKILPFLPVSDNPAAKTGGVDPCRVASPCATNLGPDISIHPALTRRRAERKAESEGYRWTHNVEAVLLGLGLLRSDLPYLRSRVGDAVFENRQDLRAGRLNERTRSILRSIAKARPRRRHSILEALLRPRVEERPLRFTNRGDDWLRVYSTADQTSPVDVDNDTTLMTWHNE